MNGHKDKKEDRQPRRWMDKGHKQNGQTMAMKMKTTMMNYDGKDALQPQRCHRHKEDGLQQKIDGCKEDGQPQSRMNKMDSHKEYGQTMVTRWTKNIMEMDSHKMDAGLHKIWTQDGQDH